MLDLSPLQSALASLTAALVRADLEPDDDIVRVGCIQRFEYTYELSWKMLRRHLSTVVADPSFADRANFQDLIREGAKRGLIMGDVASWLGFRTARGTTSHTYNQKKAVEVFDMIPDFVVEADFLLARLPGGHNEHRNRSDIAEGPETGPRNSLTSFASRRRR